MFSAEGYQAMRRGAGVVRRGDRGVLSVTGADRLTWLQGLLTNDVAALAVGGVCDAAYLTPQGRMITDMRVVNLPGCTLLDVPGSLAESLCAKLEGLLFSEDAQIADLSATMAIVEVHGPDAREVAERAAAETALRTDLVVDAPYGVPGVSLFVLSRDVETLLSRLAAAGGVLTSLETLDVVRIEAGRPAFLIDMDEQTIPLEAGIEDRVISFTKGCYVGQEVIIRVKHRGQGRVAKKLVGLALDKAELPKAGDAIAVDDREVGRLTSVVWSPALERGIALGYLRRELTEVGTIVEIVTVSGRQPARVSLLPFVES